VIQVANARDRRRIRPHDLRQVENVHQVRLRFVGVLFLLLVAKRQAGEEQHTEGDRQDRGSRLPLDRIRFQVQHRPSPRYLLNVLWHPSQNAVLLAWSLASRPGCAEACGWWQVRQFIATRTLLLSVGSIWSTTGWCVVGWPRPYFSG